MSDPAAKARSEKRHTHELIVEKIKELAAKPVEVRRSYAPSICFFMGVLHNAKLKAEDARWCAAELSDLPHSLEHLRDGGMAAESARTLVKELLAHKPEHQSAIRVPAAQAGKVSQIVPDLANDWFGRHDLDNIHYGE